MAAVTSAGEQCGNGETPLAFCGLKPASQLALERPSVYEVANRGAPHIRERLNYYTDAKRIRLLA